MKKLEEDYLMGTTVDLYNPPRVDTEIIVQGIMEILEKPSGFHRPDLAISNVANQYIKLLK